MLDGALRCRSLCGHDVECGAVSVVTRCGHAHEFFGRRLTTFEETVQDFQDSSQEWRRLFSELLRFVSSSCSSRPAAA